MDIVTANTIGFLLVAVSIAASKGKERLPFLVFFTYIIFFSAGSITVEVGKITDSQDPSAKYFIYMLSFALASVMSAIFSKSRSHVMFSIWILFCGCIHAGQGLSSEAMPGVYTAPIHSFIQKIAVPLDLLFAYWWVLKRVPGASYFFDSISNLFGYNRDFSKKG